MRSNLALFFTILSFSSLACRPAAIDIVQEIENADVVALVYVTGILAADAEAILLGETKKDDLRISIPVQKKIRVVVDKILKGKTEKIHEIAASCWFSAELMHTVILLKKGDNIWLRQIDENSRPLVYGQSNGN